MVALEAGAARQRAGGGRSIEWASEIEAAFAALSTSESAALVVTDALAVFIAQSLRIGLLAAQLPACLRCLAELPRAGGLMAYGANVGLFVVPPLSSTAFSRARNPPTFRSSRRPSSRRSSISDRQGLGLEVPTRCSPAPTR